MNCTTIACSGRGQAAPLKHVVSGVDHQAAKEHRRMSNSNVYVARSVLLFVAVMAGGIPSGCRSNDSNGPEPAEAHPKGVDDYLKDLKSDSADLRKKAVVAISQMEFPPESEMWKRMYVAVDAAAEGDVDAGVRKQAKAATVRIMCGHRVAILLNHPNGEHRAGAAQEFAYSSQLKPEKLEHVECIEYVVDGLIQALGDEVPLVRGRTAEALQEFADKAKKAVPALIRSLRDRDTWVRNRAGYALGAIKDPRAINALVANLDDKEPTARSAAADALGLIGGLQAKVALPKLQVALRDQDEDVREAAEEAIYLIRKPSETRPESR